MGGINCPPGGNTTPVLRSEYITNLAHYCDDLFSGVSCFWGANAAIERAVLADGTLDDAILVLTKGEDHLKEAQSHLGTVASLWGMIHSSEFYDFEGQVIALGNTIRAIATARMELSMLIDGPQLQESLWSNSVSDCFNAAAVCVHDVANWQIQFAKSASRISV